VGVRRPARPPPPSAGIGPDIRVGFILAPKFTLLPFAGFIDCLRHAADEADRSRQIYCRWSVIAPSLEPVEASCGLRVFPSELFPEPTAFDYVVMVGGLLPWCLDQPVATYDYIREAHRCRVSIVGLCTGGFILARAGLLRGRKCAVHTEHRHEFVEMFPDVEPVTDQAYVADKDLYTCPGGTAALDLAVSLVEKHCGKARALKGLTALLADTRRAKSYLPQRPYGHLTACGDWRVEQAVMLMERHIGRPFGIAQLASRLGSSLRELDRAFARCAGQSPAAIWRRMRLEHGRWLLLNTNRTVTQIAYECGFSDTAHFSRWFGRELGETPSQFRQRRRGS